MRDRLMVLVSLAVVLVSANVVFASDPTPSSTDLWDISQGASVVGTSGVLYGSDATNMFGGSGGWIESPGGHTLFADGNDNGYVHWIEWMTPGDVTVKSFNLFASCDGQPQFMARSFDHLTLQYLQGLNWTTMYDSDISNPYNANGSLVMSSNVIAGEVTAQYFKAFFRQSNGIPSAQGPRIIELDGFSTKVVPEPVSSALFLLGGGVLAAMRRKKA